MGRRHTASPWAAFLMIQRWAKQRRGVMHAGVSSDLLTLETFLGGGTWVTTRQQGCRNLFSRQGRMFCVLQDGKCHLKLSPLRVAELLQRRMGTRSRPAPDRSTWEWICLSGSGVQCLQLADEAYKYAASLEGCGIAPSQEGLAKAGHSGLETNDQRSI